MRNMLRNTYQDIAKVEYIIRMCEPIFLPPILQNRKKNKIQYLEPEEVPYHRVLLLAVLC